MPRMKVFNALEAETFETPPVFNTRRASASVEWGSGICSKQFQMNTPSWKPALPSAAVEESWVVATDLAEALARSGIPFHQAHQLVGRFVLESVRVDKKPADWTAEEMQRFAPEFTAEVATYLNPKKGMSTREIPGGTGPESVAAALQRARRGLAEMSSLEQPNI